MESQQHALEILMDLRRLVAAHGEFLAKFGQHTEEAPESLAERSPPHQPWNTRPPDQQPVTGPQRGWSLPPSVTTALLGIKPEAQPRLRLEPPRFNGENASDWIRKIQTYYNHHYTPLDDRLYLTQYLFDHPASDWREYWEETNKGKSWDDFLLAVEQRFDPEFYKPDVATGRDQRKPNRKTACLVANQELDHQPPQRKEEVTQVSVNQFGVLPVTVTVSSNNFANESGSNSIICDGCMGTNTLYVDSVTKEHIGCNRDCISVDINPIDDSLIDQACSKALNIYNGVIVADDIEEQSTQVQALAETDFCTEFLDSVNPQSKALANSQPLLSRGGSKDPLEEATNKGVSTDLTGHIIEKFEYVPALLLPVAVPPAASSLTASAITEVPLEPRATIYSSKATALALNNHDSFTDSLTMALPDSTTASQHSRSLVTFFGDSKQRCEDLRLGAVEGVRIFDPGAFKGVETIQVTYNVVVPITHDGSEWAAFTTPPAHSRIARDIQMKPLMFLIHDPP